MLFSTLSFHDAVFGVVMICWLFFGLAFFLRKRPPHTEARKREPKAMIGIVLQGVGFFLAWAMRRPATTVDIVTTWTICLGALTVLVAFVSVWLTTSAVFALGKQWAIQAQIVEDHKLITNGPYAIVRHPIYTGMLGMLIATGLVTTYPAILAAAVAVYIVGFYVRTSQEEKLLREAFGSEYEAYAKRVPALVPFV